MINQEQLREVLHYNPDTGVFTWKKHTGVGKIGKIGKIAGHYDKDGYKRISICGKIYRCGRLAFIYYGIDICGKQIDHINGIRDDDEWDNLRIVTSRQNSMNKKTPVTNTSGICGVSFEKKIQKWTAQVKLDGKTIHLGKFEQKFEAICARKSAEKRYGFHENHGRIV